MNARIVPALLLLLPAIGLLAVAVTLTLSSDPAPASTTGAASAPAPPPPAVEPVAWRGLAASPDAAESLPGADASASGGLSTSTGTGSPAAPTAAPAAEALCSDDLWRHARVADVTAPASPGCAAQPGDERARRAALGRLAGLDDSPQPPSSTDRSSGALLPPPESRALTAGEIEALTATIAGDLDGFWQRAFVAEGRYYGRPSFVLIVGVTPTPCDWDGAVETGAGSFYCPWDQTIYLDVAAIQVEALRYGEAGLLFTLAHEWGHHAEFQRGDLQARSRTVELVADCLAGAYLADAVARGLVDAEVVEKDLRAIVATLGDGAGSDPAAAQAHGSGEQRVAMLLVGYTGGAASCGG